MDLDQPLRDLKIVELAGSVAGGYCAKLFADLGAEVWLVGGDRLTAHQRQYLHPAKRMKSLSSVDFETVDLVIESSAPAPLEPMEIATTRPVRVQISPFGRHGPKAEWTATDLVDQALGGHLQLYGDPGREPLMGPANQAAYAAGLHGFIGGIAGLIARRSLGHGQVVDVAHMDVMVAMHQFTLMRWVMTGHTIKRMGNRYTGVGVPNTLYPCADGWVSIAAPLDHQVEAILAVSGLTHLLDLDGINSPQDFQNQPELLDGPLTEWLADQTMADVTDLLQAMRVPAAPALTMEQLLDDQQLAERDFFVDHPSVASLRMPGAPFRFSHHQEPGTTAWQPGDPGEAGPLAGLRVLDLARVWAGPLCARILSDLGADVVWVEAPWQRGPKEIPESAVRAAGWFPDNDPGECHWNRNGHMIKYSLGKRSLALDLDTDEGRRTLERLVPHFHVLLENFSPRVMPQFGFDEDRLHELNPDLVYLTMPGFGRSGPCENWVAYGSSVDSHAGLSTLIGYRDQAPWKGGIAWPDPIAGLHACSATLAALWGQLESGTGGLTIEAAQFESTVAVLGDRVIEAQVAGQPVPVGNRDGAFVAQGVYPCAGDDRWVAISVIDVAMWDRLVALTGIDDDPEDDDAIDDAIAAWTKERSAADVAEELQAIGIPAGEALDAAQVLADEHLRDRSSFVTLDQPHVGEFIAANTAIDLRLTPALVRSPAPTLGQHNREVLAEVGLSPAEIDELADAGVIVTEPPL